MYYCPISTILKAVALELDTSSMLVVGKKASTLSTLHGIGNCVKNGITRNIVSSNQCQPLAAVSPTILSVKFENIVHSIFRKENSTLKINVSHFRVLHWQQWQPPASVPYSTSIFSFIMAMISNFIIFFIFQIFIFKFFFANVTDFCILI